MAVAKRGLQESTKSVFPGKKPKKTVQVVSTSYMVTITLSLGLNLCTRKVFINELNAQHLIAKLIGQNSGC